MAHLRYDAPEGKGGVLLRCSLRVRPARIGLGGLAAWVKVGSGVGRGARCLLVAMLIVSAAGCVPPQVRELNARAQEAMAARKYDQAIVYMIESLAIYPNQPKLKLQIDAAKVMLRKAQVYRIYELVDAPKRPVETFLEIWRLAAGLHNVGIEKARVASIQGDLRQCFAKAEKRLRSRTEPHRYYLYLGRMNRVLPLPPVMRTEAEVAESLQQQHAAAEKAAEAAGQQGLALLHATAAAVFGRGDSAAWSRARERQEALQRRLGIPLALEARSAAGGPGTQYLLGGLQRRLPRIFFVDDSASLRLALRAMRPETDQRELPSQESAQCQVGTEREENPECARLKNSAEMAKRAYEQKLAALETARERCASSPPQQSSSCTSYLSSASRDVDSARGHFEQLERQVGSCPSHIERPVYKTFFYQRYTVTRRASITGTVMLSQEGRAQRSRNVIGAVTETDTYGDGLGCAQISTDPLSLPSLSELTAQAEERLLDGSLDEVYAVRRRAAQQQLGTAGGAGQRLDGLVRARFVDQSYAEVAARLKARLEAMWSSDFDLTRRIVER